MRIVVLAGLIALVAGCGGDKSEPLPAACTKGPQAVIHALADAPGPVTIDGTPISHCFNRDASGDDTQIVGSILLAVAQQLGDRTAAGDPGAAQMLGYLVGAAKRGAKRSGLADELVRRLEAEPVQGPARKRYYQRGLRAGLAQG